MLPAGPKWKAKPWTTTHATKTPVTLYYRDPIECLQSLLRSPLLANQLEFVPYRLYKTADKLMRVYSEWMSGEAAWEMQVSPHFRLPITDTQRFSRTNFPQRQRSSVPFCPRTKLMSPLRLAIVGLIRSSLVLQISKWSIARRVHTIRSYFLRFYPSPGSLRRTKRSEVSWRVD